MSFKKEDIRGDYLRYVIENTGGGIGTAKFLKLAAYNLTWHPVVVMTD
jgi:hypothetical protein